MLSRCQRYDFKRITIDTIAARLKELTDAEQIDVEERALRYVAKAADGSMRDALSLLDQCSAFHYGETLTYDNVLEDVYKRQIKGLMPFYLAMLVVVLLVTYIPAVSLTLPNLLMGA